MKNNLDEIIKIRKKVFRTKKFIEYENTLNKMMIPEKFDLYNCIPAIFESKKYDLINRFECDEYYELYRQIKKRTINLPVKDDPIIIVHPFYTILRHANFLAFDKEYLNKYIKYERKMIELLKTSKNDIVLFESPDSFARFTYSFLKYNKIKKVILTCHSLGKVLDENDLKELEFRQAMIAGCYKEHCIKDVEKQLANKKLTRINDLIMERFN